MSQFTLVRKQINIVDEDGVELLNAPILDLYYTITNSFLGRENEPVKSNMALAAYTINTEYGTNFTWGEVSELLETLYTQLEELKKKRTSMPESLSGTESTPSNSQTKN